MSFTVRCAAQRVRDEAGCGSGAAFPRGVHFDGFVSTSGSTLTCRPGATSLAACLCQPTAAAANACSTATGGAVGCRQCSSGTCDVDPFDVGPPTTIWGWLVLLNESTFAGYSDWRVPLPEIRTSVRTRAPVREVCWRWWCAPTPAATKCRCCWIHPAGFPPYVRTERWTSRMRSPLAMARERDSRCRLSCAIRPSLHD